MQTTGAGPLRSFMKVRLAAMPQCFVGFKYAAINATVGATIAEFIGSNPEPRLLHPDRHRQYAPGPRQQVFLLTLLGLSLFGIVTVCERLAIPQHLAAAALIEELLHPCHSCTLPKR